MEKMNLNCQGGDNIFKSICWVLSVISWIFFLVTGWISIFEEDYRFWTIPKKMTYKILRKKYYLYIPIQMEEPLLFIAFVLTLGISTAGLFIYLIYAICIKANSVFNGMMGSISRFHFIAFICGAALFIIGEEFNDSDNQKDLVVASLIFSLIGLLTLILTHFKTLMEPWYAGLLIKKGTFSCLIALFTYSVCYTILQLGIYDKLEKFDIFDFLELIGGKGELKDFINNCGIALPLTIGIVNICLSVVLKDIMIAAMNLILFLGMAIYYFNVNEDTRDSTNKNGDGIIEIIMIVLSALTICFLFYRYRTSVFN